MGQSAPSSQWIIPDGQWGFGNSDSDCVRSSNTFLQSGVLNILTKREAGFCKGGNHYAGKTQSFTTGAVMAKSFNFRYGVIKIKAKLPAGGVHGGLWLADANHQTEWAAGDYGWAAQGHGFSIELDVLDYMPLNFGVNRGVCGFWNGSKWFQRSYPLDPTQWHEYTAIWDANGVTWLLDGKGVCVLSTKSNAGLFPVLSTETHPYVSGDTNNNYPLTMQVAYERICSNPRAECLPGDPTMIFEDEFQPSLTQTVAAKRSGEGAARRENLKGVHR